MQISLDPGTSTNRIVEYGINFVVVNEQRFEASLIVLPETLISDWSPRSIVELSAAHLETVVALEPELIVLGTGTQQVFPTPEVLRPLIDNGIGFEVMDTRAACRTYNILMAEGRVVAAALLLVRH